MQEYRCKPYKVEACKWDGTNALDIVKMLDVSIKVMTSGTLLFADERCGLGQYIVVNDSVVTILTEDEFNSKYMKG